MTKSSSIDESSPRAAVTSEATRSSECDGECTVATLREIVREFVAERQWEKFHNPKNVCMSLAIEAAELMEHFQWLTLEQSQSEQLSDSAKQAVGEEMSDVLCYLMALANALEIDLTSTLLAKMEKNRRKYPAAEFQGKFGDADPQFLAQSSQSAGG